MTLSHRTGEAPPADWQFRYSGVRYQPAAGTTILALTTASGEAIGYMERGHINVWKSSDAWVSSTALVRPGDYDFNDTGTSIVLVVPTVAGEEYVLVRETPLEPYVEFADGANLTAEQLNRLARVSLYRDQEQADALLTGGIGGGGTGGSGTVVRVQGGAGLTGDITVSGSLNVGQGTGITVATDTVAVNRAVTDAWYASTTHGHAIVTTAAPGFMSAADKAALDALVTAPPPTAGDLDSLTDVVISGPVANEVLAYDGTRWKNSPAGGGLSPDVRADRTWSTALAGNPATGTVRVNSATTLTVTQVVLHVVNGVGVNQEAALRTVSNGSTLRMTHSNGTMTFTVGSSSFANSVATFTVATSTNAPQPTNGSVVSMVFSSSASQGGVIELNQLNDVTLTSPANDQVLKYNSASAQWINAAAPAGGAVSLDGLTDVTITTPATDQVLKYNGSTWVNAAAPGGGGGTVTQVTGGAGLTGNITTSGSLAVGAGAGVTVNADDVAINRAVVDTWYATAAQGTLAGTALQPGSVDLGYTAATRTITNTGGDGVALPLFGTAAGLVPGTASGTTNFLRADGTWAAPPGGGGSGTVTSVQGTAPIVASASTTVPVISITAASGSAPGSMSSADFTKLAGIAPGATANVGTVTGVTGTAPIVSSGGAAPAISIAAATTSAPGSMSAADKVVVNRLADLSTLPVLP
jgi:hypothetical protein